MQDQCLTHVLMGNTIVRPTFFGTCVFSSQLARPRCDYCWVVLSKPARRWFELLCMPPVSQGKHWINLWITGGNILIKYRYSTAPISRSPPLLNPTSIWLLMVWPFEDGFQQSLRLNSTLHYHSIFQGSKVEYNIISERIVRLLYLIALPRLCAQGWALSWSCIIHSLKIYRSVSSKSNPCTKHSLLSLSSCHSWRNLHAHGSNQRSMDSYQFWTLWLSEVLYRW